VNPSNNNEINVLESLAEKMLDNASAATKEAGKASSRNNRSKEQYHLGKRDAYLHLYQLLKDLPKETASTETKARKRRRATRE